MTDAAPEEPKRILIIRLSALGDVLLATPAARLITERFPKAAVHWLVEAPYAPLLEGLPYVERVIPYDKRGAHRGIAGLWAMRRLLDQNGYGLAIDLQNKPKTAFLRQTAPRSLVFRKRTAGEAFLSLLGREKPLVKGHATALFAEALAPLGIQVPSGAEALTPDLPLTDAMRSEAGSAGIPQPLDRPLVGLATGTRWATKCWPADSFARLAQRLESQGCGILLIGSPGDRPAFGVVRSALSSPDACRDTSMLSVAGLAGAIARCSLVISGDSGPAHIAAALGRPTLALFGPTSPIRWAPQGPRARFVSLGLPCSPCSNYGGRECPLGTHACLREMSVGTVFGQALDLLGMAPKVSGSRGPMSEGGLPDGTPDS